MPLEFRLAIDTVDRSDRLLLPSAEIRRSTQPLYILHRSGCFGLSVVSHQGSTFQTKLGECERCKHGSIWPEYQQSRSDPFSGIRLLTLNAVCYALFSFSLSCSLASLAYCPLNTIIKLSFLSLLCFKHSFDQLISF